MLGHLNGWTGIILLVIILLLFGAPKLPALAKSLGQSMKIFKSEIKTEPQPETESRGVGEPEATVSRATAEDQGPDTRPDRAP